MSHEQLVTCTLGTLANQVIHLNKKVSEITEEHRKLMNQASGLLHQVMLDLGHQVELPEQADEQVATQQTEAAPAPRFEIVPEKLRLFLARDPSPAELILAEDVGYPVYSAGQTVEFSIEPLYRWQICTITGVRPSRPTGHCWVYETSNRAATEDTTRLRLPAGQR